MIEHSFENKNKDERLNTIEQGRALFAYQRINEAVNEGWASEYKSYLKKLPMYIKTNGLGATFAFIFSKTKKDAYKKIYDDCNKWLKEDPKKIFNIGNKTLMEYILELNSQEYRSLTTEIISLFKWMARFADGKIKD